ncbi:MAG: hypothetical protein GF383_05460 [Candidatus Lokiarchaeota archaeon]|nr:hypothetical protein [Candidatus Lokiarchaeota archaeon]
MRRLEKIIGESVSSVIILIVGIMILSELAKQSELLRNLSTAFIILFIFMFIAIGFKIVDYFRH